MEQPHDLAMEIALVGAVLYDNDVYWRVSDHVTAGDFYSSVHREIWSTAASMITANRVADGVTLREFFETNGTLRDIGGGAYLAECLEAAAFGPEVVDYARHLRTLATRRELLWITLEASNRAIKPDPTDTSEAMIRDIETALDGLRPELSIVGTNIDAGQALINAMHSDRRGVITGLKSVDDTLGGLQRGKMTVLAARPSVGKTALGTKLLDGVCRQVPEDRPPIYAGYFSLEMPSEDIGLRIGAANCFSMISKSGPHYSDQYTGRLVQHQRDALLNAARLPHMVRARIDDRGGLTLSQISARMRQWKRDAERKGGDLGVVFVDHMGHMNPDGRTSSQYERLTQVSGGLLALAKRYDVALVALCQLNRESEKEGRRPELFDLRESGAIEQDADTVLFLHRQERTLEKRIARETNEEKIEELQKELERATGIAEVIVRKNRGGPLGTITLGCDIACNAFWDLDGVYQFRRQA